MSGPHNLIARSFQWIPVFFLLFVLSACAATRPSQEGLLDQKNKANGNIKELNHEEISPQEINEARCITPGSVSDEKRKELIQRLEAAKAQDDRNEQKMLNDSAWTDSGTPLVTVTFDQQKEIVDNVVKDLENGKEVCWSMIEEALRVPALLY